MGALSDFLRHFRLVAELNGWTEQEWCMYLGVSLSGSPLKILETVDALAADGYEQLLEVLEQRYQQADQVALYRTQLQAKHQGPKETLGDFGDDVEWTVRLAYPNAGYEVADDLGRDTFVAGLHNGELQKWVHQAHPSPSQRLVQGPFSWKRAFGRRRTKVWFMRLVPRSPDAWIT